ncbi:cytochrome c4 [Halomonas sp. MCCC 1A17488]|uniref:c-type cytochrome n=1 Tax=unclassified Halomonas TaxID=2609666 RepID=UPI0018D208C8|nr:c-type cytochrome [Halomonas sp. SS10-MC5]MCE8018294.1 cytochrome c4 [Halomonas sp. MCCC 1A17488]MCG3241627.1 cytochrome c4 [Halomonas sp. MCCC 1A17488]QPP48427.1 cytochrome c4 [Halomonas sp. SS10-MC5]
MRCLACATPGRRALALSLVGGGLLATEVRSQEGPAAGLPLEEQLQVCAGCHGEDGNAVESGVPSLAGQPALALTNQLIYFRERLRRNEVMTPQAQGLSDEEIQALAAHYAEQALEPPEGEPDEAMMERGRELARQHRCASCHRTDFSGHEQMPRLAHQREDYLVQAMRAYRERTRGGPDTTMVDILRNVDDAEIEALAHFLAHYERG